MSTTPTATPSRAKRTAPALPIPEAAAVTMPILPSSRMVPPPFRSGRHVLGLIQRVECRTIGVADFMALDLQGRRHLTVGYRKGFRRDRETPHPLDRRKPLIDAHDRGADCLGQCRIGGLR